jgi:hypothetical protein
MLDPINVFANSCFKGTIQASHPEVIAFVGETDKIWAAADKIAANDGLCSFKMIIKLPPGEYQYTPEDISGHPSVNLFTLLRQHRRHKHTTIFCLFDMMVKILTMKRCSAQMLSLLMTMSVTRLSASLFVTRLSLSLLCFVCDM